MKKMKKTKLELSTQTIRELTTHQLSGAAGGYATQRCSDSQCHTDNCTNTCGTCPPPWTTECPLSVTICVYTTGPQ